MTAFRESIVLAPTNGGTGLLIGELRGVRWLMAFTDRAALARWARARRADRGEVGYLSVFGWRLLDVVVPRIRTVAGVALDVAGPRPMLLPPVHGIVAPGTAVDIQPTVPRACTGVV